MQLSPNCTDKRSMWLLWENVSESDIFSFLIPLQPNPDKNIDAPTVGTAILKSRALFTNGYWYWIAVAALAGFTVVFNLLFMLTMTYLNRK